MCRAGWGDFAWGFGSREEGGDARVGVRVINLLKRLENACLAKVFQASSLRLPGDEAGKGLRNWDESTAKKTRCKVQKRFAKSADLCQEQDGFG